MKTLNNNGGITTFENRVSVAVFRFNCVYTHININVDKLSGVRAMI